MANERTILVVEDDPELGEMLRAYFWEHGYAVKVITSGEEASRLDERCQERLRATIPYFYPAADWQALQESPETKRLAHHIATLTSADGFLATPEELYLSLQNTH